MSDSDNSDKDRVNADKLVTRLLDLIQDQQRELSLYRAQTEKPKVTESLPKPKETARNIVQVSEIAPDIPKFEEGVMYPVPRPDSAATPTDNRRFFMITGVVLVITLFVALRPQAPEVAALSANVRAAEQTIRDQVIREQQATVAHNGEVVGLQKKLSDTEDALTNNEKELIKQQSAYGELLQKYQDIAASNPGIDTRAAGEEAGDVIRSIRRIAKDLGTATVDLGSARDAFQSNVQTLAENNRALHMVVQTEQALASGSTMPNPDKKGWKDFADSTDLALIDQTASEVRQTVKPPADTDSIETLRKMEVSQQAKLNHCLDRLRVFQQGIGEKQGDILDVQKRLIAEQAKLGALQTSLSSGKR